MAKHVSVNQVVVTKELPTAFKNPAKQALVHSRSHLRKLFAPEAQSIQWGEMRSPLGPLYAAVSPRGLCMLDFGRSEAEFLDRFQPPANLEKNPKALQTVISQLREYFAGDRISFNLSVDLSALTPFQRQVLDITGRIAPGHVWTYRRVAAELGRPDSSRPVGQALARNPVPIVIPCHRVIASDGSFGGYSGGAGINDKKWLLRLEGALE